jgi:hypothetical protein
MERRCGCGGQFVGSDVVSHLGRRFGCYVRRGRGSGELGLNRYMASNMGLKDL